MTLYKDWTKLMQSQTDDTFEEFWKEYSGTEKRIYSDILDHPKDHFKGTFTELVEKYDADPVLFTGFLDGIQDSLISGKLKLEDIKEDTAVDFEIDLEQLYFNMLKADAAYLYTLDQWDDILDVEKKEKITKDYKRSKTVVKEKKVGRNDPCPCGSGKKYKHCCGRNA
ncbi:MAG: SEC-C metal-binding domain-containing protein [Eubacteriaceae bacterium]|nr:SEC-C metal-binding domain-containing protein [Eubacteriaceae bacterium]